MNRGANKATVLLELFETRIPHKLFNDQSGRAWVSMELKGMVQNIQIGSRQFREVLLMLHYSALNDTCGTEAIKQVQTLLSVKARYGERRPLSVRVAWADEGHTSILIDIGKGRAVHVTRTGWEVVDLRESLFKWFDHMLPLPAPDHGGRVSEILDFLRVPDRDDQILLCAWLGTVLVPGIPHAALHPFGGEGASKSYGSRLLRTSFDPSSVLSPTLPSGADAFAQVFDHHYCPILDNQKPLTRRQEYLLCRAITGFDHSKRKNYSNDSDFTYSFRRPFILNGKVRSAATTELLDRLLLVEFERSTSFRTEEELDQAFSEAHPRIFGAILDCLVGALRRKDPPEEVYEDLRDVRMQDWARWALRVAEAQRIPGESFIRALKKNLNRQHGEILATESVARALLVFMSDRDAWRGTPANLYENLSNVAQKLSLTGNGEWPGGPQILSRRLNEISRSLRASGLEIKVGNKDTSLKNPVRIITVRRVKDPDENTGRYFKRYLRR